MALSLSFIILANWVLKVHARNDTIIHGWQSEPDGRGTWSILWSCLVTVFLCTWSVMHCNVPKRHDRSYLFSEKLIEMVIAVLVPESTCASAVEKNSMARDHMQYLARYKGYETWTLTHLVFMYNHGFYYVDSTGNKLDFDFEQLQKHLARGVVVEPPISKDELKDRGESDWIINIIRVGQTIWFLLQILFRAIQHFHITALEISTVAFVCCSIFSYGFSWSAAQNVQHQILVEVPAYSDNLTEDAPQQANERAVRSDVQTPFIESFEAYRPRKFLQVRGEIYILFMVGAVFGGIHCLAWNSPYPTTAEKVTWRVCSSATAVLPVVSVMMYGLLDRFTNIPLSTHVNYYWRDITVLLYFLGRLGIITLALTSLRSLPADAYATVSWSNYFPHIAS